MEQILPSPLIPFEALLELRRLLDSLQKSDAECVKERPKLKTPDKLKRQPRLPQRLPPAGPAGAQRALRGGDHHRLRVRTPGDHEVDRQLEAEVLVAEA